MTSGYILAPKRQLTFAVKGGEPVLVLSDGDDVTEWRVDDMLDDAVEAAKAGQSWLEDAKAVFEALQSSVWWALTAIAELHPEAEEDSPGEPFVPGWPSPKALPPMEPAQLPKNLMEG